MDGVAPQALAATSSSTAVRGSSERFEMLLDIFVDGLARRAAHQD